MDLRGFTAAAAVAVLLVVNVVTIVVGFAILIGWNWLLGTIFLVCSVPLWIYGFVFEKKYSIVARRSQDQAGDLAPPAAK